MNGLLAIPLELRLVVLFILGALLGGLANLGIYRLAWNVRSISPWFSSPPGVPARRWSDRLPILGWFGLRRESPLHGAGFWVRLMLVELLAGVGLALLYWWRSRNAVCCRPIFLDRGLHRILEARFAVHALVIWLMLVGSLIDADEKTIPDAITTPGTLLGLLIAALYPWSLLPTPLHAWNGWLPDVAFLTLTSPTPWPAWLDGFPRYGSLLIGLGCWWMWCFALMRRTWYPRHGHWRAVQIFVARLWREIPRSTRAFSDWPARQAS